MTAWLLNLIYLALVAAAAPVLLFRTVVRGKYRRGWREKLWGAVSLPADDRPSIWFHAVSVGEVLQLQPVLELLGQQRPGHRFVISTTTTTGHDVARQRYPQHTVIYCPLDFSWAVGRALTRIAPVALVLVELELWPNLVFAAARRNIPILLINGRISAHSYAGYMRIRRFMRAVLQRIALLAVQNDAYASRLIDLGAAPARVATTGSIKFDGLRSDRGNAKTAELRQALGLGPGDRVFVAGSTQAPEERYAIETWLALREKHPGLRLILVPRHRERFEEVARLVSEEFQLPLLRRSRPDVAPPPGKTPVLLLDTLGELSACWGLADVAFVGGSLTRRGGQNMMEPAGYGAAVMFGPNTHNFRDVVDLLIQDNAAVITADAADLTAKTDWFLSNPHVAAAFGDRARSVVLAQRGATQRTVDLVSQWLEPPVRKAA